MLTQYVYPAPYRPNRLVSGPKARAILKSLGLTTVVKLPKANRETLVIKAGFTVYLTSFNGLYRFIERQLVVRH